MPSVFKKIFHSSHPGGKKNPYADPAHVNNPERAAYLAKKAASSSCFKAEPSPAIASEEVRPASPRGSNDYLAEARMALGRDPVTGKTVPDHSLVGQRGGVGVSGTSATSPGDVFRAPPAVEASQGARSQGGPAIGEDDKTAKEERSGKSIGKRYDLFVREMKEKKMQMDAYDDPAQGYYAPERSVGEFYAPPSERG